MVRTWLLALLFPAFAAAATSAEGPRTGENFTVPGPAIPLVWIAPGTFWMTHVSGTGDDTEVTLTRGFWLGRTEVTQLQWQAVVRHVPGFANTPFPSAVNGMDHPVESVSWDMILLFCAKLNELERAAGRLPPGYEYALPTEAQWEYAARAGTTGKYAGPIDEMAWHLGNSGGTSHPVARKKPNAWGLYDMHGNVAEWCTDWYAAYPGGAVADYAGPLGGVYRVLRGSSFLASAGLCHLGFRNFWKSQLVNKSVGFRLALAPLRTPAAVPVVPAPTK